MKNSRNLILAAIFMIGFLAFWDSYVMSRYTTQPVRPSAPASVVGTSSAVAPKDTAIAPHDKAAIPVGNEDKLIVLEVPGNKVSLLSRGARLASWQIQERDHWIELVEPEKFRTVTPLETFPDYNFAARKVSESEAVFATTLSNGVVVTKTFQLLKEPPFHQITITLANPTQKDATVNGTISLGSGVDKHEVGSPYNNKEENLVLSETRAVGYAGVVKSWKPGFIFKRHLDSQENGPFEWVGVDNNHFVTALVPVNGAIPSINVVGDRDHSPHVLIPLAPTVKAGETVSHTLKLYAGPKSYAELQKLGHNLDQVVDFGFFGPIAKFLLVGLKFFKSLTGNFGWAIILLTFCIQLVVFPLTKKNLQHSVRMRELQPQIKKLQEQYKSDPKRLQVETFNFYKKNGMKYMGMEGCFPMLLQIPVFFAFYSTLHVAYELRGAPWIFWIKDLGVHDPLYVLPILMGAGMFLQQKMTAVVADPAQARLMMFMPIMFTFMFLQLPAGLVLYWVVNSITTIVIQVLLGFHKQSSPQTAS